MSNPMGANQREIHDKFLEAMKYMGITPPNLIITYEFEQQLTDIVGKLRLCKAFLDDCEGKEE